MKNLLTLSVLFAFFANGIAQKDSSFIYKHAIYESPLHIFAGKMKVDYEYFGLSKFYSLGGAFIYGSTVKKGEDWNNAPDITKNTIGLEVNNKFYTFPFTQGEHNFYINLVGFYHRLDFEYRGDVWAPTSVDGINIYNYKENVLVTPRSNRVGISPQFGYTYNDRRMIIDIYFGTYLFKDYVKNNIGNEELPLNAWKNAGLNSIFPTAGIKVGILL